MKKLIAIVLLLLFVFLLFIYNTNRPIKQDVSNNVSHSDVEGVYVEIGGIYNYPDKKTLAVSWSNKTKRTVTYGEAFKLQRLKNGEWIDCSLKEVGFAAIAYFLKPNETVNKEYLLTDIYDITAPGTYRFVSKYYLGKGDARAYSAWVEFVIE